MQYDGLMPPEVKRLRQFEEENTKSTRIAADLSPDAAISQDGRSEVL